MGQLPTFVLFLALLRIVLGYFPRDILKMSPFQNAAFLGWMTATIEVR
ncbi:hypothetical protein DSM3645_17055 [Blastopirellula marina DSM 3645]|uniref:Uncharacterized protein n=1 Tax=Blastopirellula marina DSM 3645 TaxID=314230 RepID=A3ZNI6_9BACT|nr:hypothetical protein DSM3645_17055 [Blastopirellula marina DSM 3645]